MIYWCGVYHLRIKKRYLKKFKIRFKLPLKISWSEKILLITSAEKHKMSPSLGRHSLALSAVREPTFPGLCPDHPPSAFAAKTESHFSNAENAFWTNSCNGAVGAWLIFATDMSAEHRIKTMQEAHWGSSSPLLPSTISPVKFKTKRPKKARTKHRAHSHQERAFSVPQQCWDGVSVLGRV